MMRPAKLLAGIACGSFALAPSLALGQAQARVHGKVTNSEGEILAGVQMTISDTETNLELAAETDASGRYSVVIVNSTRPYVYRLELEGYQTLEETFKAPINSNTVKDFELKSLEEARAQAAPVETPQSRAVGIFNSGAELARSGDAAGAEAKFRAALELYPDLSPALTALAAIRIDQGDLDEALRLADQAVAIDPGDPNALSIRYRVFEQRGDEAQAAAALEALEAASPEAQAQTLYNQGVDAFNAGDVDTARQRFEAAVGAHQDHARAQYMLGLTMISAGDSAGAKAHLERFLELAPDDPDAETARQMLAYQ